MSGPLIIKETQNSNSSGKDFKIYFDYWRENRAKTIKVLYTFKKLNKGEKSANREVIQAQSFNSKKRFR